MGKTTLSNQIPSNLIIDFEGGSKYIEGYKVKCIGLEKPENENEKRQKARFEREEYYLSEIGNDIWQQGYPYEFITVDTTTALEEMCEIAATKRYKNSAMGKNFDGDSILELDYGAGYGMLRREVKHYLNKISKLSNKTIYLGHLKDKITTDGKRSVTSNDIDLTGKIRNIISQQTTLIGYLYREQDEEDETINYAKINFKSANQLNAGTRIQRLAGKDIVIAKSVNGEVTETYWDQVYKELPTED